MELNWLKLKSVFVLNIYLNKNRPLRVKPSAKFNPKFLEPFVPVLDFQDGGALHY